MDRKLGEEIYPRSHVSQWEHGEEYDVDAKISSIEFTHMRIQDARNLEPLSVCTHTEAQIVPRVEQASAVHIRIS
jgi:hypothetical protein